MVDAALNIAAEQVIEYSAYGALLQRDGNRGPAAAPQNLYQRAEIDEFGRADSWVADRGGHRRPVGGTARRARPTGLGDEPRSCPPRRAPIAPRRHRRGAVGVVPCARRRRDRRNAFGRLGVPVAKVMQPHRQTELPQLAARGFFEKVDHPVNGPAPHSTLPVRFSTGPDTFHRSPHRCSASTTASCCAVSACPTPRSPNSRTTVSSARNRRWVVAARRRASAPVPRECGSPPRPMRRDARSSDRAPPDAPASDRTPRVGFGVW